MGRMKLHPWRALAFLFLTGAGPSPAQQLALEPIGNSVRVGNFDFADLDGDGTDELVAVAGNHAYVYIRNNGEFAMRSQFSFDRGKSLFYASTADLDGDGGKEFALGELDRDTLKVTVYGLTGSEVAPRDTLIITRAAVGGSLDTRGPFPWDAQADLIGIGTGPGGDRALLFKTCAGYSRQPRGVLAFRAAFPHTLAWQRLVGPCTESPGLVAPQTDPARTRIVLAGSGYCNGAVGSGLSDSLAAIMVVGGSGELLWWRQVAPARGWVRDALADLDGDGAEEIVVGVRHQVETARVAPMLSVLALDDGRVLSERVMEANVADLATGDLGRDGRREILVLCEDGILRVFDGALRPRGSVKAQATIPPLLLVADLTGEGSPEIVVRAPSGEGIEIYDGRLRLAGRLATTGREIVALKAMRTATDGPLLGVRLADQLQLYRVRRLSAGARLLNLLTGEPSRHPLPALGLALALLAAAGLVVRESRRRLGGEAARDRVRALVSDLKIIRHGVRSEGEKPEPLVRLLRGLRTCAEPADFAAGLAILRDVERTHRSYVGPTLQRILRATRLVLPGAPARALGRALRRATADLDRLFERLPGAERDAPRFLPLCGRAERSLVALEEQLRSVEAAALGRVPADPLTEANAACEGLAAMMKERGVAFRGIEVTGEPGARVFIEAAQLRRVIHDLLLNAIEACQDAAEPHVAVAIACGARRVSLSIRDDGRGVAPADAEAIFHGRSTKTPPGGAGLAHARSVVESYSGTILLRASTPWEKTVFEVTLCRVPS
jgi:signal transduction histidine kinase